jgi:hypothetical protein
MSLHLQLFSYNSVWIYNFIHNGKNDLILILKYTEMTPLYSTQLMSHLVLFSSGDLHLTYSNYYNIIKHIFPFLQNEKIIHFWRVMCLQTYLSSDPLQRRFSFRGDHFTWNTLDVCPEIQTCIFRITDLQYKIH